MATYSQQLYDSEDAYDHYWLSSKGVKQSHRNNSEQMWVVMGCDAQGYCFCSRCRHGGSCQTNKLQSARQEDPILQQDQNMSQGNPQLVARGTESRADSALMNSQKNKSATFKSSGFKRTQPKKQAFTRSNPLKPNTNMHSNNRDVTTGDASREKYLKECYVIAQYLQKNKATRDMATSKIQLLYEKPALEAYGRENRSNESGFAYNNYMKTFNTVPHRYENSPVKYQTFKTALNFGKRTKADPEERWRRIHRQFVGKLNEGGLGPLEPEDVELPCEDLEATLNLTKIDLDSTMVTRSKSLDRIRSNSFDGIRALSQHTQVKGDKADLQQTKATANYADETDNERIRDLKRSGSWGKKQHVFFYRYKNKDGETQLCKDRHGITCYVDPSFKENREAMKQFLKKVSPIEAEDVQPEDRNIDRVRVGNYLAAMEQGDQHRHYLMPNTEEPYRPEKYSRWKKSSVAQE